MSSDQLEKALSFKFPNRVSNNSGVILVDGEPPTADMLASAPGWLVELNSYAAQLESYKAFLTDGYTDEQTTIKLKTTEYAQKKFSQLATSLDLSIRYAGHTEAHMTSVWDFNGVERQMTYGDCIRLLLRYAAYCKNYFDQYAP